MSEPPGGVRPGVTRCVWHGKQLTLKLRHAARRVSAQTRLLEDPGTERRTATARTTRTPEPLYFCVQKHLASWLLIKHRDVWSGPIDIATFAPLSVKSEGDFDDILAADMPDVWVTGRPANARGGATGKML